MRGLFLQDRGVYVLLTLAATLWGGNAVAAKFIVAELPPATTAFVRFWV